MRSPARPVPGRPSPPRLVRVAPGPGLVPLSPHRRCRGERGQGGEGRSKTPDSRPQRGNDRGRGRGHEPRAARGERPRGTATEATHPEARRDGERDAQLGRHGAKGRPAEDRADGIEPFSSPQARSPHSRRPGGTLPSGDPPGEIRAPLPRGRRAMARSIAWEVHEDEIMRYHRYPTKSRLRRLLDRLKRSRRPSPQRQQIVGKGYGCRFVRGSHVR